MSKTTNGLIFGLIIGLIIGGIGGYFIHNSIGKNFIGRGNFQIDENTKNDVASFFGNTTDINEINSYCQQNRMNCVYYCKSINPNNEICGEMVNFTRVGGR